MGNQRQSISNPKAGAAKTLRQGLNAGSHSVMEADKDCSGGAWLAWHSPFVEIVMKDH